MENGTETWTDMTTGRRMRRQVLGACHHGRLILRRAQEGTWDLFWLSTNSQGPDGAFMTVTEIFPRFLPVSARTLL
jgi:hypothetical protein